MSDYLTREQFEEWMGATGCELELDDLAREAYLAGYEAGASAERERVVAILEDIRVRVAKVPNYREVYDTVEAYLDEIHAGVILLRASQPTTPTGSEAGEEG